MKKQNKKIVKSHHALENVAVQSKKSSKKKEINIEELHEQIHLLQNELGVSQMYLNVFWNLMNLSIWSIDKRYRVVQTNEFFADWMKETFGVRLKAGESFFEGLPNSVAKTFKSLWNQSFERGFSEATVPFTTLKGKTIWLFLRICPLVDINGKTNGILTTARDVSEQKRIEEELKTSRELYLALARHIPESNVFLIDKTKQFMVAEGTEMRRAGINPDELKGKFVEEAVEPQFYKAIQPLFKPVFSGKTPETEVTIGNAIYALQLVPVRNEAGKIEAAMGLMRNITNQKMIEAKFKETLEHKERALKELADANAVKTKLLAELRTQTEFLEKQSREDALTGLYNRRYLNLQLEQEFKRAKRYGNPLSVVMCDIDHFKKINDTYSHQVGDEVLKTLGRIFKAYSRSVDTVARFGGEEFVLVLPETPLDNAVTLCEKLRVAIEHYTWSEIHKELSVTISFGISDNVRVSNYERILAEADEKLYEAKHGGRNRVAF